MTKANLQEELKQSMLAKNELKTSVLRMILSSILNKEKEKKYKLKEEKDTLLTDE